MHSQATTTAGKHESGTAPNERQLGRWDFEDGGYLKIVVSSDVDTAAALEMVETLVALRRKELERKRRQHIEEGNGPE